MFMQKSALNWLYILSLCLVLGSGLSLSASVQAASPAQQLQELLDKLNSVSGSFEQLTSDARGQRLQEATGQMLLQKPGQFYWETAEPFPQVLVSNGEKLWVYDPDLEQVTIQKLAADAASPAYILTSGAQDLTKHFLVKMQQKNQRQVFALEPLEEDSLFTQLEITFKNGQLSNLQISDSLNQKTRIDLHLQEINQPIPSSKFEFKPPAGVDIIQQ